MRTQHAILGTGNTAHPANKASSSSVITRSGTKVTSHIVWFMVGGVSQGAGANLMNWCPP